MREMKKSYYTNGIILSSYKGFYIVRYKTSNSETPYIYRAENDDNTVFIFACNNIKEFHDFIDWVMR